MWLHELLAKQWRIQPLGAVLLRIIIGLYCTCMEYSTYILVGGLRPRCLPRRVASSQLVHAEELT